MDLQHGVLFAIIGCTATLMGFFIAFLIINYNMRKSKKKKIKGPMDDLMKYMPGWKGDDCQ